MLVGGEGDVSTVPVEFRLQRARTPVHVQTREGAAPITLMYTSALSETSRIHIGNDMFLNPH